MARRRASRHARRSIGFSCRRSRGTSAGRRLAAPVRVTVQLARFRRSRERYPASAAGGAGSDSPRSCRARTRRFPGDLRVVHVSLRLHPERRSGVAGWIARRRVPATRSRGDAHGSPYPGIGTGIRSALQSLGIRAGRRGRGGDRAARAERKRMDARMGVGRHILGSQVFDYWQDPWGDKHEHYCDGDMFTADVATGIHEVSREAMSQWGPRCRAASPNRSSPRQASHRSFETSGPVRTSRSRSCARSRSCLRDLHLHSDLFEASSWHCTSCTTGIRGAPNGAW